MPNFKLTFEEFEARKRADRERLNRLPPDEAQASADAILQPRLWKVVDPQELAWPGDLADDDPVCEDAGEVED